MHYLHSPIGSEMITGQMTGTAIKRIILRRIKDAPICIAPLNEQHRIVAAIETQFTRLDAAVTALKRSQANLKRYRAAVLKAACEGRLVPTEAELAQAEGRSYEPASVLLERILAERRQQWMAENPKKKYQEPVAPDTSDLPELPEGWCWAKFDQLLFELKNGYFGGRPSDEPIGLPILRISAVRPLSVTYESPRYIPDIDEEKANKYILEHGDLLFTRYNGNSDLVGACGMVRQPNQSILYPDKLIRAKVPNTLIRPEYLELYCATGTARRAIEQRIKSTAGQNGIAGSDIKELPIMLPPIAEQQRIVAEVERRLSLIDQLEKTVAADLARANRLRQSILKRAFTGKLVPQDPNDEPASVLLERIQAAKNGEPV
jgi:type I restriction enzyme S subunit